MSYQKDFLEALKKVKLNEGSLKGRKYKVEPPVVEVPPKIDAPKVEVPQSTISFRQAEADSMKKLADMEAAKPPKEPAGGDSMVRKKEAIDLETAQAQLDAGVAPNVVGNRTRNTVRLTKDPTKADTTFRDAEADSMKKLADMDAAKTKQTFRDAEDASMKKLDDMEAAKAKAKSAPTVTWKDMAKAGVGTLAGLAIASLSSDSAKDKQTADAAPAPAAAETPEKYKIAKGDTLSQLAKDRGVSVADIAKANELKDIHKLQIGQEIVMPKKTGSDIYQYGVGTASGPKSSKEIVALTQKKENRDKVNESLLAAFNEIVRSDSPNIFAEAKKKEKKADKDYDQDGKIESAKDEVWGSRLKAAKEAGKLKEEEESLSEGSIRAKRVKTIPQKMADLGKDIATHPNTAKIGGGAVAGAAATNTDEIEDAATATADTVSSGYQAVKDAGKYVADTASSAIDTVKDTYKKAKKFVGMEQTIFSEKELAFLEAMSVAPTPEDQAPNPSPKNNATGGKGKGSLVAEVKASEEEKEEAPKGGNVLHMAAKRAADNMSNVKHKFSNGETVNMTKGMAVAFLNRHSSAKTADDKDAILNHANKSLDAFKHIAQGGAVPKEEKPKIKLGSMKGK